MAAYPEQRVGETLLGKYRVHGILGRGGMGVVFDAEDMRLGRAVAIKVLQAAGSGPAVERLGKRFTREAKAIAGLIHPHLVTLLEFDVLDDGTPAMVMERIDGVSLRDLLTRHAFTASQVVGVLAQTLEALSVCHEQGLVHRDLKPGNLLIHNTSAPSISVKLIDFGLTKLVADEGATALTLNGQVFGSPRFMAPEQWLRREIDGRTDLYALALIGFCLVQGEHFIPLGNPIDVCRAHIHQHRPTLETHRNGAPVPPLLTQILHRAAHPRIEERFESARTMRAALEPLISALGRPEPLPLALLGQAGSNDVPNPNGRPAARYGAVLGAIVPRRPAPPGLHTARDLDDYDDDNTADVTASESRAVIDDELETGERTMAAPRGFLQQLAEGGELDPDEIDEDDAEDHTFQMPAPGHLAQLIETPSAGDDAVARMSASASNGMQRSGAYVSEAESRKVRFGGPGQIQTAITKHDMERALRAEAVAPRRDSGAMPLTAPPSMTAPPRAQTPGPMHAAAFGSARSSARPAASGGRWWLFVGVLGGAAVTMGALLYFLR